MGYAAALSQHPLPTQAVGEVAGTLLEQGGSRPDLVAVFTTRAHAGALEDIAGTLAAVLQPLALVGCAASGVIGPGREVALGPGVAALAGPVGPLRAVRLHLDGGEGAASTVRGWPEDVPFAPRALLLFSDPFGFPLDVFLTWMARAHPGVAVIGGAVAGARGPGGSRMVVDGRVHTSGAVGVLLGPGASVTATVAPSDRLRRGAPGPAAHAGPGTDGPAGTADGTAALVFASEGGHRRRSAAGGGPATMAGALAPLPTAGFATVAELAPVGGRNAHHAMAAAVALLGASPPR